MNTTAAAQSSSDQTPRRRRLRALLAGASVAFVGVAGMPAAEASAAGVATQGYRYVAPSDQVSSISPSALPAASANSRSYVVTSRGLVQR